MSFIRVKEIGKKNGKKYRYAYLVSNKWRKRLKGGRKGSRQKVSKYLGRVLKIEKEKEIDFYEFIEIDISKVEEYLKNNKSRIVNDLVRRELLERGFFEKEGKIEKEEVRYDTELHKFVDLNEGEDKVVIEMNEGFLCKHTIRGLINFKNDADDEREKGIELAKAFLEAGLKVPNEIFVGYFEKV